MLGAFKQSLYLSNPAPTGGGAPDMLAVGHSTTPFISVYTRDGNTFTKVADPDVLPPNIVYGADWSPDGTILAVTHVSAPYLTIYKWTGTALEKMTDIQGGNPSGTSYNVRWNPAGTHLAVVHSSVPYASVYEFNGTSTFTKVVSPFDIPPRSNQYSCAWAPDGSELYTVGPYSSTYGYNGQSYSVSGSSFTQNRIINTGITSWAVSRDPNSDRLVIGNSSTNLGSNVHYIDQWTPNATIPRYDVGVDPSFFPYTNNQTRGVEFSQTVDGKNLLAAAQYTSPFIRLYDRVGDTYTQLANPDVLPASNGFDVRFNRTSTSLAVAHQSGDLFTVYDLTNNSTAFVKASTSIDILPSGTPYCVAWNH